MSTCAVMLVKDEADVIEATVRHLLYHVDEVIVADNLSSDGTREILEALPVTLVTDPEIGYYQSRKVTALAHDARALGHEWVVAVDADEIWHCGPVEQPIADLLASLPPDLAIMRAYLYDHRVSDADPEEGHPFERIGWHTWDPVPLLKVACRLLPGLVIEQGNHGAHYPGPVRDGGYLHVRHFPYRSVEQFVRKVRNGAAAYAASNLPYTTGQHWRDYGALLDGGGEDTIREVFETWFKLKGHPSYPGMIYDPAPVQAE